MIGETISHYRIIRQLGSGGMGIVYEAQDLTLGRSVALKFLPPGLASDPAALDRFLLEARAASALNHPNICTIYAVENADGQSFIAMELLDGQTLDGLVNASPNQGGMPMDRVIEFSTQMSDALEAAHAKGIVHRDIKPANIFVTKRGQVKILDFGLAKLLQTAETETLGATAHLTTPGSTVGTIAYMSPEQARGEALDARTDLFSLGTVIYQMLTGQLPFSGATSAVIFHAILERNPVPPMQLAPATPAKLQEIVGKLLEKDRDLRYQSAADLRGDLKRLKRDSDSQGTPATVPSSPTIPVAVSSRPKPASSSAVVAAVRENKLGTGVTAIILLGILAVAAYGVFAFLHRRQPQIFQNVSATKVTDSGKVIFANISPDGKYILSMVRENGQASLRLLNVPTNSNTQVAPPAPLYYLGVRFSPDSNYLYFIRSEPGNGELKYLFRAPLLGGSAQKIVADVDSNITFSPDGSKFAYIRNDNPDPGKYQLIIRTTDSGQESVLTSGPISEGLFQPAWSPDGKVIMCGALHVGTALAGLVSIDANTGKRSVFSTGGGQILELPTWLPNGHGLAVLTTDQTSNFYGKQIGWISYPDGKISPITHDTNNYTDLSVSASGKVMAAVQFENHWGLYVIPSGSDGAQAKQITTADSSTNFAWTKDRQLIGDQQNTLSLINPETGERSAFPTEPGHASGNPTACADGRYVAFILVDHANSGNQNVWRMDSSGGNLKQLTSGKTEDSPWCSPDSGWIFYIEIGNERTLSKVSIDGGQAQVVATIPMSSVFDISSDGQMAVFTTLDHSGGHKEKLVLVQTDSGQTKQMELERERFGLIRFSPDGKSAIYPTRENGVDNLWSQPLDGSKGKQLTSFTAEHIWDFRWSPDGSKLAIGRGHAEADVVLIRDNDK